MQFSTQIEFSTNQAALTFAKDYLHYTALCSLQATNSSCLYKAESKR
jgi:hypothetical protein